MLAVFGVVVAGLTLLLIQGSLIYYRLPSAPRWLRNNRSWQTSISSSFTIGIVAALFMVGQSLADLKSRHMGVVEIALIVAVVVAFGFLLRRVRGFERRLGGDAAVPSTVADDIRVVPLPQAAATPEEPPGPGPRGAGSPGRKAA